MTTGLGAWSFGFYHQGMAVPNDRVAAGLKAFKQALIDNGHEEGINLTANSFGHSATKATKAFQKAHGITVDGVIGPETARYLFRVYTYSLEGADTIEIPDHLLQKQGGEESGHDPVAQGEEDSEDEGWAELHMPFYPKVTLAQAWDPRFAIQKLGSHLKEFYVDDAADWDGAVASWNVGTETAKEWVAKGKPTSGLVIKGVDYAARATTYVARVKSQTA